MLSINVFGYTPYSVLCILNSIPQASPCFMQWKRKLIFDHVYFVLQCVFLYDKGKYFLKKCFGKYSNHLTSTILIKMVLMRFIDVFSIIMKSDLETYRFNIEIYSSKYMSLISNIPQLYFLAYIVYFRIVKRIQRQFINSKFDFFLVQIVWCSSPLFTSDPNVKRYRITFLERIESEKKI